MSLYNKASLIQVPSLYKDGLLVSTIPEDRSGDFTVARGSNLAATRIGEDGYIKKGYENLLLQSNSFDTTWILNNVSVTSGQSGYDGSTDAWLLSKSGAFGRVEQNIVKSGVHTFSVYAKQGTTTWMRFVVTGTSVEQYFQLTGVGFLGSSTLASIIDAKIESVGGGWYRCSVIFNMSSTTGVRIYPADGDGDASGTSGSIYIQDAQLNQGLVAYPYLETTTAPAQGGLLENTPRLDWSNGVPAVLVEEGSTNLFTYSEYINNSSNWATDGCDGFLTTDVLSPEGKYNVIEIIQDTSFGNHWIRQSFNTSVSGGLYTQSVYLKRKNADNVTLRTLNTTPSELVSFNLFDGTHNGGEHWFIKDAGDGWYRCGVTSTQYTSSGLFYIYAGGSGNYTGDGITGVYAYGAQAELGTSPSSYIPTYGTTQTRSNETVSDTFSIPTTATIYNSFYSNVAEQVYVLDQVFNVSVGLNKVAIAFSPTAVKISAGGTIVASSTGSYDTTSLTSISLGSDSGADYSNAPISGFYIFPEFLTDDELNSLTA